jgi:predicted metal-dependent peptidase
MVDKAIASSRGKLPNNISEILEIYNDTSKVSWKKELKDIIGNKKANKTKTIMRPNRRQPNRIELKGNKKDYTFTVVAICDVSGSMYNKMVLDGLNELHYICKLTGTSLKLIQVDTEVHSIEDFNKSTKVVFRTGNGGTEMEPAIEYIKDNRIEYDVIVLITDGYIENISKWKNPPKTKMMFLVTTDKDITGIDNYSRYKQFTISEK